MNVHSMLILAGKSIINNSINFVALVLALREKINMCDRYDLLLRKK